MPNGDEQERGRKRTRSEDLKTTQRTSSRSRTPSKKGKEPSPPEEEPDIFIKAIDKLYGANNNLLQQLN